jgi:hypothetical protein
MKSNDTFFLCDGTSGNCLDKANISNTHTHSHTHTHTHIYIYIDIYIYTFSL